MSEPVSPSGRWARLGAWFDERFRSPAAIYGLIVFSTFVAISEDDEPVWDVLIRSVMTLVVFFIAHVFAHTLTEHARHGLRAATRDAMRHAGGMLYASLPSALVLIVCGLVGIETPDATDLCALSTVIVLALLGYNAYRHRGARLWGRLAGAVATAALGVFIVLLEVAFH